MNCHVCNRAVECILKHVQHLICSFFLHRNYYEKVKLYLKLCSHAHFLGFRALPALLITTSCENRQSLTIVTRKQIFQNM